MIDINLIPPAFRKDGKADSDAVAINIPHEILSGVLVGVIVLILIVHLSLGAIWGIGMLRLSHYDAQWQQVGPDKAIQDGLNKKSAELKKRIKMLSDMTINKEILWAPKFNAISDALPKGLWVTKMILDKTGLTIDGSVVSKSRNEINNVDTFVSKLRQNNAFMKGFISLEVNSIQSGRNNSIDVTDFTVMAKANETKSK